MSENDAISRIRHIDMPEYYLDYYSHLSTETYSIFQHAALAKSTLIKPRPVAQETPKPKEALIPDESKISGVSRSKLQRLPTSVNIDPFIPNSSGKPKGKRSSTVPA